MARFAAHLLLLTLAVSATSAQIYTHDFKNDPVGTTLHRIWSEIRGEWSVTDDRTPWTTLRTVGRQWLQCDPRDATYQHVVAPNLKYLNCCVECVVRHPGRGAAAAGLTLRANNPGFGMWGTDLVMAFMEGQTNGFHQFSLRGFSPQGAPAQKIAAVSFRMQMTIRLLTAGNLAYAQVDSLGDNRWDLEASIQMPWPAKIGPIGVVGLAGGMIDHYRLWDAVICNHPSSPTPQTNTVIKFKLFGLADQAYQAASALGNRGIRLSAGFILPLAPDGVFVASASNQLPQVFRNYAGKMDSKGEATISLAIPNAPVLKGMQVFTAFINIHPRYIGAVSNDHRIVIR